MIGFGIFESIIYAVSIVQALNTSLYGQGYLSFVLVIVGATISFSQLILALAIKDKSSVQTLSWILLSLGIIIFCLNFQYHLLGLMQLFCHPTPTRACF